MVIDLLYRNADKNYRRAFVWAACELRRPGQMKYSSLQSKRIRGFSAIVPSRVRDDN